jgi:3D (Asp-Asp-Asp) domain-containing protein
MEAEKYLVRTRALRSQRDVWKQAAVGVLALSITGNIGLYGIACSREARHREETAQLRTELRHVEAVRDDALEELGRMANDYALEAKIRREQAEGYEALGAYQYIGECTITAYCPCAECCGRWADGVTASGLPAGPGIVAVDPDVIPLGSTVVIDGQKYLAADTGSGVTGNHIDVCLSSHGKTVEHGIRTAEVWVATNE